MQFKPVLSKGQLHLQRRQSGLQSLKYLLYDPLQKKLINPLLDRYTEVFIGERYDIWYFL